MENYINSVRKMIFAEIENGRTMEILYKEDTQFRKINAYIMRESSPGRIFIKALQMNDPDKQNHTACWQNFALDEISDAIFTDVTFDPHPDFDLDEERDENTICIIKKTKKDN